MSDAHDTFIKTPKQLVIVVVAAFAVPIALFALLIARYLVFVCSCEHNEPRKRGDQEGRKEIDESRPWIASSHSQ